MICHLSGIQTLTEHPQFHFIQKPYFCRQWWLTESFHCLVFIIVTTAFLHVESWILVQQVLFPPSPLPGGFFPHPSGAGIGCVTCFGQRNVNRSVQCQFQSAGSLCPLVLGPKMAHAAQTCTQEPDQRNLLNQQERPDSSPSAAPRV